MQNLSSLSLYNIVKVKNISDVFFQCFLTFHFYYFIKWKRKESKVKENKISITFFTIRNQYS